jgi:hypothetical protein
MYNMEDKSEVGDNVSMVLSGKVVINALKV